MMDFTTFCGQLCRNIPILMLTSRMNSHQLNELKKIGLAVAEYL